jgi:hypothetical protein
LLVEGSFAQIFGDLHAQLQAAQDDLGQGLSLTLIDEEFVDHEPVGVEHRGSEDMVEPTKVL